MSAKARSLRIADAVQEHAPSLLAVAGNRLRDRFEGEDVVQDAFVELLEADDVGAVIDRLGAWLLRVAQNKILDRFRRRATREQYAQATVDSGEAQNAQISRDDPDSEWTRTWLRREIAQALEVLPADQRLVFVKHELEGMSFEEIARETGVKVNTLLSRKHAAVQFLRDHLKEVYDELGE